MFNLESNCLIPNRESDAATSSNNPWTEILQAELGKPPATVKQPENTVGLGPVGESSALVNQGTEPDKDLVIQGVEAMLSEDVTGCTNIGRKDVIAK